MERRGGEGKWDGRGSKKPNGKETGKGREREGGGVDIAWPDL